MEQIFQWFIEVVEDGHLFQFAKMGDVGMFYKLQQYQMENKQQQQREEEIQERFPDDFVIIPQRNGVKANQYQYKPGSEVKKLV